jgi:hypothetical protein
MKIGHFFYLPFFIVIILLSPKTLRGQAKETFQKSTKEEVLYFTERDLSANYFKNVTSLGGTFTTGNVEQIVLNGTSETVYRVKRFRNEWDLGLFFDRKFFDSEEPTDPPETNTKYIYGYYRMDYFLTQDLTFFVGGGGYSDEVKGIPLGSRGFIGVSDYLIWTDKTALKLAGGYEFVGERRDPPDPRRILHTAKVTVDFQRKINPNVDFVLNLDSLKSFTKLDEWLINGEVRFNVKLYKILTLFAGFTVRFDNVPTTGFKKLDTISSLSLGVSFESPKPRPPPVESKP